MNRKEALKKILPDAVFALQLAAVFFAVYAATPLCGLVSSFPFLIGAGLFVGYTSRKVWKFSAFGAAFALFFSLIITDKVSYKLCFVLAVFVILLLSQTVAVIFFKRKNRLYIVLSFILLAFTVFAYTSSFGNIVAGKRAAAASERYFAQTYPKESFENLKTYYNLHENAYITSFEFFDGHKICEGKLYHTPAPYDTYNEYAVGTLAQEGAVTATTVLRNSLPNAAFTVEPAENDMGAIIHSGRLTLTGEDRLYDLLSYKITVHDEVPSRLSFREEVKKYFDILKGSGFVFDTVTFFGGEKNELLYRAQTDYEMDAEADLQITKP